MKDLLGSYTAESISPKVDLKQKRKLKIHTEKTNIHMTNEQTKYKKMLLAADCCMVLHKRPREGEFN